MRPRGNVVPFTLLPAFLPVFLGPLAPIRVFSWKRGGDGGLLQVDVAAGGVIVTFAHELSPFVVSTRRATLWEFFELKTEGLRREKYTLMIKS